MSDQNIHEILLFLVVFSNIGLAVQALERASMKKNPTHEHGEHGDEEKEEEEEQSDEDAAAEYEANAAMEEFMAVVNELIARNVVKTTLLYIIHKIPYTSQSTKSRVDIID